MPVHKPSSIETIEYAYAQLSHNDKWWIDRQAMKLELEIKDKNPLVNFGRIEALELLFKTGRWLRREGL